MIIRQLENSPFLLNKTEVINSVFTYKGCCCPILTIFIISIISLGVATCRGRGEVKAPPPESPGYIISI